MRVEDKILFNEIKNRNYKVFEALFREYYPPLVRFARSFIFDQTASEDLVQSFFVCLWENAPSIQIQHSFKQYCYQSVRNRCMNQLRDLRIEDKRHLLYIEAVLQEEDSDEWIDPNILLKIKESINNLPTQMALIFKLKYLEGKKNREISELINVSENTVKTQLSRARNKLRNKLMKTVNLYFFF